MVMKYCDKKVYLLSTSHAVDEVNTGKHNSRKQEPVIIPAEVHDYNAYKGIDEFLIYNFKKKMMKWWKRAATHLMKVQSFIVHYIQQRKKAFHAEFHHKTGGATFGCVSP